MQRNSLWVASFSSLSLALAAPLAQADDLKALREEVAQLKKSYEERIAALEARIAQAESSPQKVSRGATPSGEATFNPAISLVLAGTYTRLSQDPEAYAIDGFVPSGGEVGPPRRSFGLGESELGIAANIDPTLRGQMTLALAPEGGADVEEAYIQTLALGGGATLKAGRFLSGIGYTNGQHAHAWDFADAPLAYKAMLGGQWKNDGVQAKWIAPTDLLVEMGVEAGAGGAFPTTDRNKNGNTVGALFAHVGGDAGDNASWRAGLSVLGTSPRDRQYDDVDSLGNDVTNTFTGKSRTWIADAVWKQDFGFDRKLIVQGEYFRRRESGTLAFDVDGANLADGYRAAQSGYYVQTVYQFMPRWRAGYRYDRLDSGEVSLGGTLNADDLPILAAYKPKRNSLMVDWSSSEFARLRLQFARDESRRDLIDRQLWLQYVVSLGAHGAHRY
ncbi:MAG: hypothetical protein HZA64_12575 [Rhodocyclales bacterium]|nr:hypothetical protein [Rhodocyclales bacterium]